MYQYAKNYLAAGSKDNQTDGVIVKGFIPCLFQRLWKTKDLDDFFWNDSFVTLSGKWKESIELKSFRYRRTIKYIQVYKWDMLFIGYFTKYVYLFSGIIEKCVITDHPYLFREQGRCVSLVYTCEIQYIEHHDCLLVRSHCTWTIASKGAAQLRKVVL